MNKLHARLAAVGVAELLSMAVWFSASAVSAELSAQEAGGAGARAWLTMAVQLGFVAGTLLSALANLPDRIPGPALMSASAAGAALATGLIPPLAGLPGAVPGLRLLTGFFLAGVYPTGMKVVATWTRSRRGEGMGLLVGALTLGTAAPQLLRASAWTEAWREILYAAAALGLAGALAAALWVREGPHQAPAPRFDWRAAGRLMAEPRLLLANLGYLGHMWELYAVWTWMPAMLAESFAAAGWGGRAAAAVAFMAIAAGAPACYLAGLAADRVGRPAVTIAALAASGACTVLAGSLFPHPALLAALCAVWGFAVIADSAQFSACVSELAEPGLTGTALTIQNSLGFLLTLASIRLVAEVQAAAGWRWAFLPLALGPAWGIAAMAGLRRRHARGV